MSHRRKIFFSNFCSTYRLGRKDKQLDRLVIALYILVVLCEGKTEVENHRVDQQDNLKNINDDEAYQSALTRNARQVPSL